MFDIRPVNYDPLMFQPPRINCHEALLRRALALFNRARRKALLERAKGLLLGHICRLLCLAAIPPAQVHGRHHGGLQEVDISQICGTLDRTADFDHHFQPLSDRLRDRWVSVAVARCQGIALPAVNLVQVTDRYFVEDGHHRLSVARMFGQSCMDAEVTVWEVSGPLPWEQPAAKPSHQLTLHPAQVNRTERKS